MAPKHVWITKFALTRGVFRAVVYEGITREKEDKHISVHRNGLNGWTNYRRPDWHETEEAALARAEEMRLAKIKSLKKQIAKLEQLKFEAKRSAEPT